MDRSGKPGPGDRSGVNSRLRERRFRVELRCRVSGGKLVAAMLIEALRSDHADRGVAGPAARAGRSAARGCRSGCMHEDPGHNLDRGRAGKVEAALSRSTFFDRFRRAVGAAPMDYLLTWRMALAQNLLRRRQGVIAEVARRVAYSSATTSSAAFSRHVGTPPGHMPKGERVRPCPDHSRPTGTRPPLPLRVITPLPGSGRSRMALALLFGRKCTAFLRPCARTSSSFLTERASYGAILPCIGATKMTDEIDSARKDHCSHPAD